MFQNFIITIFYACFSLAFIVVGPAYSFLYQNTYSMPTGIIFPFIDYKTTFGYILNLVIQSVISLYGIFGLIVVELTISIFDSTLCSMNHLAKFHLHQMNENIKRNLNSAEELAKFVYMMEDYQSYVNSFNEIFYWKHLLQPTFTTYCVAIGIFCQYSNDWSAGYGFAAFYCLQIFVLCNVGQHIISAVIWSFWLMKIFNKISLFQLEDVSAEIYFLDWKVLSPKYKKTLCYLMCHMQNGKSLLVGPFGTLSHQRVSGVINDHLLDCGSLKFHIFSRFFEESTHSWWFYSTFSEIENRLHAQLLILDAIMDHKENKRENK